MGKTCFRSVFPGLPAGRAFAGFCRIAALFVPLSLTGMATAQAVAPASGMAAAAQGAAPDGLLDRAVSQAVATHPSVLAAKASLRAAGIDIRAAKWQRFPSVSVEGLMIAQSTNSSQLQAVVDQPIWTGGRISGGIALAGAKRDAALAGYGEAIQSIALAVSQSYYELQRWRLREQILQQSIDRQNGMIDTMKRRVKQEVSPLSDLDLAQTRGLQLEQQLLQAKTQSNSAIQRLRELVGDGLYELPVPLKVEADGPEFVDDEVLEAAQGFDPKLARLKADVNVSGAEARIARSSNLPKLSGQYSYSEVFGHRFGLVLRAQSSGGLSGFAAADAARLREQSAEMQVEAAGRELRDQMVIDLQTYKAAREQAARAVSSAGYAQRVMESYLRQFTSGRRTWLDVMNAVRELTSAQIDSLDAAINARAACARILLRTGHWRPATEEARS